MKLQNGLADLFRSGRSRPERRRYLSIYSYGGRVLVPHTLQVIGGVSIEQAPFRLFSTADDELQAKLRAVLDENNVSFTRSLPNDDDPYDKGLLRAIGAPSWKQLYTNGRLWTVDQGVEGFNVERWKTASKARGMEPDKESSAGIKPDMSADEVVTLLVEDLRALSGLPSTGDK